MANKERSEVKDFEILGEAVKLNLDKEAFQETPEHPIAVEFFDKQPDYGGS